VFYVAVACRTLSPDTPLASITTEILKAIIVERVDRGCKGMARDIYLLVSGVYSWAIGGRHNFKITTNACSLSLKHLEATLEPRTRVFSEAELRAYGKAAGEQPAAWGRFYELALLTGIRRTELAGMRWDELTIIPYHTNRPYRLQGRRLAYPGPPNKNETIRSCRANNQTHG